jgi:hypothetical protein
LSRRFGVTTDERRAAGEDRAEDRPQPEHVAALVHLIDRADRLFRGHVRRRAENRPGLRLRFLGRTRIVERARGGRFGGKVGHVPTEFREAPIHDLHFAEGPHHDVQRLEIAVEDAPTVSIADGMGNGLEDRDVPAPLVRHVRSGLQQLVQGLPFDELEGQIGAAVDGGAQVVDGGNARMLELGGNGRFVLEPPPGMWRILIPIVDHFDGDLTFEGSVSGAVNGPHAAAGDQLGHLEPGNDGPRVVAAARGLGARTDCRMVQRRFLSLRQLVQAKKSQG